MSKLRRSLAAGVALALVPASPAVAEDFKVGTQAHPTIQSAVAAAVNDPEVKVQFDTLGLEGVAMPPAQFSRFVADEYCAAQDIARRIRK